jgi:PKD repeat protein
VFTNARGETRLLVGGGGSGLIAVIDDSTPSDYTVFTNVACAPNEAPQARLTGSPLSGHPPLAVDLDGSASFDPDAGDTIAEYTFDFGDGTAPLTQAAPTVSHSYSTAGNYHASLTVKDSRGKASTNVADLVIQVIPKADYYTVTPCRLLDTRTPADGAAPVPSNTDRVLAVTEITRCGVSPLSTAVVLNITVDAPTGQGFLTAYPGDLGQPPGTSTLNFNASQTRANNAILTLPADGRVKIRPLILPAGSTHVIVDVTGFFVADTP